MDAGGWGPLHHQGTNKLVERRPGAFQMNLYPFFVVQHPTRKRIRLG
jgi:hypothetical protein